MEKLLTTDEEILKYFGWEETCKSPHELTHLDGSFATGQATRCVLNSLRVEYISEMYDNLMEEMSVMGIKNKILKNTLL